MKKTFIAIIIPSTILLSIYLVLNWHSSKTDTLIRIYITMELKDHTPSENEEQIIDSLLKFINTSFSGDCEAGRDFSEDGTLRIKILTSKHAKMIQPIERKLKHMGINRITKVSSEDFAWE